MGGVRVLRQSLPVFLGTAAAPGGGVRARRAARDLIKGYQALESSRSVDTVVLDKTGTVTTGRMSLTGVQTIAGTGRSELLRYAGGVEQASEHAVAAAISAAARAEAGPLPQAERFTALPGLGASGVVDGHEVIIGRAALFADRDTKIPPDLARMGRELGAGRPYHRAHRLGRCRPRGRRGRRHGQALGCGGRGRAARARAASGPADRGQRGHRPGGGCCHRHR